MLELKHSAMNNCRGNALVSYRTRVFRAIRLRNFTWNANPEFNLFSFESSNEKHF